MYGSFDYTTAILTALLVGVVLPVLLNAVIGGLCGYFHGRPIPWSSQSARGLLLSVGCNHPRKYSFWRPIRGMRRIWRGLSCPYPFWLVTLRLTYPAGGGTVKSCVKRANE